MVDTLKEILGFDQIILLVVKFTPKLVAAGIVLLAFIIALKVTKKPIKSAMKKAGLDEHIINLVVENVYRMAMLILGSVMAASQLGIDVGAAIAGLGVVGLAIGFAAQDTLANIISGFMIYLDKPFKVHDWVKVGESYGEVWEITMRSTRIKTVNNTYIIIPNKVIIDEVLDNRSKYGKTRVVVSVGIAYKESIDTARKVILESLADLEIIQKNPAPDVVVRELDDSSVNLDIRIWVSDASLEKDVYVQTLERTKKALDAAGIQIPFPHLQLFVDDVEDRVWEGAKKLSEANKPTQK